MTTLSGPVHAYEAEELSRALLLGPDGSPARDCQIPTLAQVFETMGGRIGLEIELKGPEPEAAEIVASLLKAAVRSDWPAVEVTSFEPWLLTRFRRFCSTVPVDLLTPLPEPWMEPSAAMYQALHRGRMAGARAIHLHATQLTAPSVDFIRANSLEVHAWNVNDDHARQVAFDLGISQVCTDQVRQTLAFRRQLLQELADVQHRADTSR